MKKMLLSFKFCILAILNALVLTTAYAVGGDLFDISFVRNVQNGGGYLTVRTTPSNHTYPSVGIQITSPQYIFSESNNNCVMKPNGWCLFEASDTRAKTFTIKSRVSNNSISRPSQPLTVKLALDAAGNFPMSVEAMTINATDPGKIIGYLYGWQTPPDASAIKAAGYSHVLIAFGLFSTSTPGELNVESISGFDLTTYVQALHQNGLKVLLSLGGASTNIPNTTVDFNEAVSLAASPSAFETTFVSSMQSLVTQYGFDGFDIDIEHGLNASHSFTDPSYHCSNSTFDSACDIFYLTTILTNFHTAAPNQLISFAPQIANIAATPSYSETWGNYASLLMQQSICDVTTWAGFQNYNSGCAYGINGTCYPVSPATLTSTTDAAVAFATDLLANWPQTQFWFGTFQPYISCLSPSQVVIGYVVPNSSGSTDGSPAVNTSVAKNAIQCLRTGQNCYSYIPPSTYPSIGGVFDWTINYDATTGYQFAKTMYPCVVQGNCS